jgi:GTPase SAR1 family protein
MKASILCCIYLALIYNSIRIVSCRTTQTVIIVGPTGSGKSTLINRFLNASRATVSHLQESCTQTCTAYAFKSPVTPEGRVHLIDTPGFPDTASTHRGIQNYNAIVKEINARKPDVIVFLIKYGRWKRENDILQSYLVVMDHFKSYGWYVVLGTSWPAVDVPDENIDLEFEAWKKSIYESLQPKYGIVAAFGTHRHCRTELQRIMSLKPVSVTHPILTVTQQLQDIYKTTIETVQEKYIVEYLKTAKQKLSTLQTSEGSFFLSTLGSFIAPTLLPLGFPLLAVLALSTTVASYSGYNVFNTYYDKGFSKEKVVQDECEYIETHVQNISLTFQQKVDHYLLNLQEITGIPKINFLSLCSILDDNSDSQQQHTLIVRLQTLHAFLNTSCSDLLSSTQNFVADFSS